MSSRTIRIWRLEDAPKAYQTFSGNGADDNWVAFIPEPVWLREHGNIPFLSAASGFGDTKVECKQVAGGVILIGSYE